MYTRGPQYGARGHHVPANAFPGAHQVILESGWGQVGLLYVRASDGPLVIQLARQLKISFQQQLPSQY